MVVDGAQLACHSPVDLNELPIDFFVIAGHKMLGPSGIGAVYGRRQYLEKMPPYQVLLNVAKKGGISSAEEKAFLGCFIILQFYRSHAIMNSMLEWNATMEREKFEHFVKLKWFLSDRQFLFNAVNPIVTCKWIFFKLKNLIIFTI